MSITIRNDETDRLIRELAEMRGVTPLDAVHDAVQSQLLQERCEQIQVFGPWSSDYDSLLESYPGDATIMAIDERRLEVARLHGMDKAFVKLNGDVWPVAGLMTLGLLLAPFIDRPRYVLMLVIAVVETILMIFYFRHLSRKEEARKQWRKHIAGEIKSLCASLPAGLMFLSRIPDREPDYEVLEKSATDNPDPTIGTIL